MKWVLIIGGIVFFLVILGAPAAFMIAVPMVPDQLVAVYRHEAANLTGPDGVKIPGLDWHHLVAIDAVRMHNDFSAVKATTIHELAQRFIQSVYHPGGGPCSPGDAHCTCHDGPPDSNTGLPTQICVLDAYDTYQLYPVDQVMRNLNFTNEDITRAEVYAAVDLNPALGCTPFTPNQNTFQWPVPPDTPITECFGPRSELVDGAGYFHYGVDLGVPVGTPIHAASSGRIATASEAGSYGNLVILIEPSQSGYPGLTTYYAHLSRFAVTPGMWVSKGDIIGWSGNTGVSTGPHLHFETRPGGADGGPPVDPCTVYH